MIRFVVSGIVVPVLILRIRQETSHESGNVSQTRRFKCGVRLRRTDGVFKVVLLWKTVICRVKNIIALDHRTKELVLSSSTRKRLIVDRRTNSGFQLF
jgi:hypothetical protein